jgi:hypothetical protein
MKDGDEKNVMPVSTAEYNPCGWRAWLNNTTIILGMQNVLDADPPFVAGNNENGYDESLATISRFCTPVKEEILRKSSPSRRTACNEMSNHDVCVVGH